MLSNTTQYGLRIATALCSDSAHIWEVLVVQGDTESRATLREPQIDDSSAFPNTREHYSTPEQIITSTMQRFDFCICLINDDAYGAERKKTWREAIGLIKNMYCERIICLVSINQASIEQVSINQASIEQVSNDQTGKLDASREIDSMLRSLGFVKQSQLTEQIPLQNTCIFSYNLNNYNRKRQWNNTRYWANPENFNKRF